MSNILEALLVQTPFKDEGCEMQFKKLLNLNLLSNIKCLTVMCDFSVNMCEHV